MRSGELRPRLQAHFSILVANGEPNSFPACGLNSVAKHAATKSTTVFFFFLPFLEKKEPYHGLLRNIQFSKLKTFMFVQLNH